MKKNPNLKSYVVTRNEVGQLLGFLSSKLNVSKKKAKQMLDARSVYVNGKRIWMAQSEVFPGDQVEVHGLMETEELTKGHILYQDASIVIINKPPGLASNGERGSAEDKLKEFLDTKNVFATHRIDKDTSGCLMFALTNEAKEACEELFKQRKIDKFYHAVALGRVPEHFDAIRTPIDGRPACTKLRVLKISGNVTHLKLKLETGRTHQIRKHLASIRHPVLGDKDYYRLPLPPELVCLAPRQLLHSKSIRFMHPFTGKQVSVEAPFPQDMRRALNALKIA